MSGWFYDMAARKRLKLPAPDLRGDEHDKHTLWEIRGIERTGFTRCVYRERLGVFASGKNKGKERLGPKLTCDVNDDEMRAAEAAWIAETGKCPRCMGRGKDGVRCFECGGTGKHTPPAEDA